MVFEVLLLLLLLSMMMMMMTVEAEWAVDKLSAAVGVVDKLDDSCWCELLVDC